MTFLTRVAVAVLLVAGLSACGHDGDDRDDKGGEDMDSVVDGLVCGLVDEALVRRIVGDAEIGIRGWGLATPSPWDPPGCTVQDLDRHQTVLQVLASDVRDPARWRQQVTEVEPGENPGCVRYDGVPGLGYGCTYDRGVRIDGAGVHVMRGDRLIRVTLHHWHDVTPAERLALAEEIAVDVDRNVTAHAERGTG